ncbi:MAG: VWA domain-containing protein [Cyanobacteria bacterium REEB446]|nr:VWA domain-containing protein [Cyanobacteria bacterium REEB446]
MNIKHLELLTLLFLLPLLIGFLIWSFKKSKKNLLEFCVEKRIPELIPSFKPKFIFFKSLLLCLATLFLIISLISPRWNFDVQTIEKQGSNIFIAIDVSKSMLASDISPNRLFRAKLEIAKLIDKLDGDKIGIIVFAGTSFLQSPLTHDYGMVKEWVQQIDVDSITAEGTSIKSAIETAIRGFSFLEGNEKYLVIVSDGEEQDQQTNELATEAKKQGIKIISIGIGSAEGAPINYNDELIKDKNGKIVISKLNESLLKDIAKITDGKYILSRSGNLNLENVYDNFIKKGQNRKNLKSSKIQRWQETYQIFLSFSLLFLIIESLSGLIFNLINKPDVNNKNHKSLKNNSIAPDKEKPEPKKNILPIIIFLILSSLYSRPAEAFINPNIIQGDFNLKNSQFTTAKELYIKALSDNPQNARLNYNLARIIYKENNFKQAESLFKKSIQNNPKNDDLKEKAFYNLGNSYFKQKDYKKAISSYKAALKLNPQDRDAIYNLKLAEKLLQDEEENKNNPEENKTEKEKQKNKDGDKEKKDNPKKEENQTKAEKKPEENPENKNKLSEEELENLLLQVQEGEAHKQGKAQPKQSSRNKNLNPW